MVFVTQLMCDQNHVHSPCVTDIHCNDTTKLSTSNWCGKKNVQERTLFANIFLHFIKEQIKILRHFYLSVYTHTLTLVLYNLFFN